jgi:PAS domain S-box-containing protein
VLTLRRRVDDAPGGMIGARLRAARAGARLSRASPESRAARRNALTRYGPVLACPVVLAVALGWEDGTPAERIGLVVVSAAGCALVGSVVQRAVAAVHRGRQISDAVLAALQDALVVHARDGRIVRVNDRMCALTGFSEDELVGASAPLPYWPPESIEAMGAMNREIGRTGRGEYDVDLLRKGGERFHAIVTVGVIPEDGGRVVMIKDIAARVQLGAESHQVREAFARSAGIIGEYLYSGELHPDERFVVTARGPGLAALLGASEDSQQLLDGYDEFVHPDDRASYDAAWRFADMLGRKGEIVEQEYRLVGLDGVARWIRDRAAVTVLGDDRVLLTGAACDISAQRRAEEERSEAVRRLERLSTIDVLTELFNRRHFSEVLRARLSGSAPGAAIALVDVDHSSASTTRMAIRRATACCARSRAVSAMRRDHAT